jgi:hypothetical protein
MPQSPFVESESSRKGKGATFMPALPSLSARFPGSGGGVLHHNHPLLPRPAKLCFELIQQSLLRGPYLFIICLVVPSRVLAGRNAANQTGCEYPEKQ